MARTPAPRTRDATRTAKLADLALQLSDRNSDHAVTCSAALYNLRRARLSANQAWLDIIDHANGRHDLE